MPEARSCAFHRPVWPWWGWAEHDVDCALVCVRCGLSGDVLNEVITDWDEHPVTERQHGEQPPDFCFFAREGETRCVFCHGWAPNADVRNCPDHEEL